MEPDGKIEQEDFDQDIDGSVKYQVVADQILPLSWWLERLRKDGFDPGDFLYSIGHSVWTQASKNVTKTLYANRFKASLKNEKERGLDAGQIFDNVRDVIEHWQPTPTPPAEASGASLVLCASDWQIGKVDMNGGTPETTARILNSFNAAKERALQEHPSEVLIVDSGDSIENLWNVSSQRSTNDLGLPAQVETVVRLMLEGIKLLAPLTPRLRYIAVPSNHGRSRIGYKQPAGDENDDYGLAVAKIVRNALSLSDAFSHVTVEMPEPFFESVGLVTNGTRLGVVHGHQAGAASKLETWWAGQALGRGPVADADILIAGHYHNFNIFTTGDDRHIFVCPAADPGSAWVTNLKGYQAGAGMLSFLTQDGAYGAMSIL